jgi:hypothetical protein
MCGAEGYSSAPTFFGGVVRCRFFSRDEVHAAKDYLIFGRPRGCVGLLRLGGQFFAGSMVGNGESFILRVTLQRRISARVTHWHPL